jgi:hypothetical protein
MGNTCYHSVQKLLSSCLLSTNLKIKINTTVILSVVLYGHKTSLTQREENRLKVFKNENISTKEEVTGDWRKSV